ncbi:MAG: hypothetical protein SGI97_07210 [candidate division Zixibacteria bacterium]|nr:hypothetical protein [candidate division Zixibacteria bacterium]
MNKVLLVCYYFPPLGLAGVGRPLNLFTKLPFYNWDVHILTVKAVAYRGYEPELLDGLDLAKIFRAGSRDPQRLLYLLGVRQVASKNIEKTRSLSERFFPDSKIGWVRPAIRLGRTLIENYRYSAIISTSPPVSCHLVAQTLSREFALPWIADFRDYWGVLPIEKNYSSKSKVEQANRMLERIKNESKAQVAVNRSIAKYLGNAEIISNGYNSEIASLWTEPSPSTAFTIGILGHQFPTLIVEPLLKVLQILKNNHPDLFENVRLLQVGEINKSDMRNLLSEYHMEDRMTFCGRLSHTETVKQMSDASLNFIAMPLSHEGDFVPGKVFDLLASGRPLLAYAPKGSELEEIVSATNNGFTFSDVTHPQATDYVAHVIKRHTSNSLEITPLPEYAKPFSSDKLAQRFANLLDRIK